MYALVFAWYGAKYGVITNITREEIACSFAEYDMTEIMSEQMKGVLC